MFRDSFAKIIVFICCGIITYYELMCYETKQNNYHSNYGYSDSLPKNSFKKLPIEKAMLFPLQLMVK